MKLLSFNVGVWSRNANENDPFYWKDRAEGMYQMILEQQPDVICFQELWFPHSIYIPKGYHKVFGTGLEHPIYVKAGVKHGVGICSVHWSMARINGVRIFSVHGHWTKKVYERIFRSLAKVYARDTKPSVLAGDFNMDYETIHEEVPTLNSARVASYKTAPDTYIHFHNPSRHGELDHFLLYKARAKNYKVLYDGYGTKCGRISDHYPIEIEI